jgi:hypothetical protein
LYWTVIRRQKTGIAGAMMKERCAVAKMPKRKYINGSLSFKTIFEILRVARNK